MEVRNHQKIKLALRLIVLLGIVSALGDITYEGARSVYGPYLAFLGASAGVVGVVSGFGEFLGYAFRLVSGYFTDRTERYWLVTILGYAMLIAVPLLALAGNWQTAAVFIFLERIGKAIRIPAKDVILSHAAKQTGRGWGFGIHEALDQIGGIIGPLIFTTVLLAKGGYRDGFSLLWIPALLTVVAAIIAKLTVPNPAMLEEAVEKAGVAVKSKKRLPGAFWVYTLFSFTAVAGFANFQIIAFHFMTERVVSAAQIPLFYTAAMGIDALVALFIGKSYDRTGLKLLIIIPILTIMIPFFVFQGHAYLAFTGMILWGAVMGIHETIMRAAIADLTSIENRGAAYGIFNTLYGTAWFLGSALMGFLYGVSIGYLISFVVATEVSTIFIFIYFYSRMRRTL